MSEKIKEIFAKNSAKAAFVVGISRLLDLMMVDLRYKSKDYIIRNYGLDMLKEVERFSSFNDGCIVKLVDYIKDKFKRQYIPSASFDAIIMITGYIIIKRCIS